MTEKEDLNKSILKWTVLTLNDWSICRPPTRLYLVDCVCSFAHHIICGTRKDLHHPESLAAKVSWLAGDAEPKCWCCHAVVPEEIQALINLQEWK